MKSAVNAFNKLFDSNTTKELMEYLKKENQKSRENEKVLMQMQCNMQLQMMQILCQSHGNNSSSWMLNVSELELRIWISYDSASQRLTKHWLQHFVGKIKLITITETQTQLVYFLIWMCYKKTNISFETNL